MTIDEASKLYNIPLEILHEYEKDTIYTHFVLRAGFVAGM